MAIDRTREQLVEELTPSLLAIGLDVEAVELTPAGRRRVLRVAVDKDGGVTLDDVADATKRVSELLDGSDVMGEQPYTLEVTSPGIDRPLTLPRHWRRNRGRLVKLVPREGATVTGRILDSDDTTVRLEVDGASRTVRYDEVTSARVQVEFNPPRSGGAEEPGMDAGGQED